MHTKTCPIDYKTATVEVVYRRRQTASRKPTVVLLHGLQSSSEMFQDLLTQNFMEDRSVLAPDFIGFGGSSKPEDFSYDLLDQLEILKHLLQREGISECDVIGHSMGGMIGCLLLESSDCGVTRFANLEGNLRLEDGDLSREISKMTFKEFKEDYFPNLLHALARGTGRNEFFRHQALSQSNAEVIYKAASSIASFAQSGRILRAFTDSRTKRGLIRGARSHFGKLPSSIACPEYIIPESGHFLLIDNPEDCYRAIESILTL